jgi:hypothetical protein
MTWAGKFPGTPDLAPRHGAHDLVMQTTHEPRPNRRYRRLIPAALTAATLSVVNVGVGHAATPKPARPAPAHMRVPPRPTPAVVPKQPSDPGATPARVGGR